MPFHQSCWLSDVPRLAFQYNRGNMLHTCTRVIVHTHTDTFPTSSNPILSGYLGTTETNCEGSIGGRSTGRHKKQVECFVSESQRRIPSTRLIPGNTISVSRAGKLRSTSPGLSGSTRTLMVRVLVSRALVYMQIVVFASVPIRLNRKSI